MWYELPQVTLVQKIIENSQGLDHGLLLPRYENEKKRPTRCSRALGVRCLTALQVLQVSRCALVCERLRCEPWRPWGWGETTRRQGLTRRPARRVWHIETGHEYECATRMLRAALLRFCKSPQTAAREARELYHSPWVQGEREHASLCPFIV